MHFRSNYMGFNETYERKSPMKLLKFLAPLFAMFWGGIMLLILLMMVMTNAMLASIPDVPMPT